MDFFVEKVETMIYSIRGMRVMLDSDLAQLYGIETKALNRQVRRNLSRFPADFLIEPNLKELEDLRYQIGAANRPKDWNYKRRSAPMFFTEYGVAMLSSVLHSEQAIQINIAIMRTFTKLKSIVSEDSLEMRVEHLESEMEGAQKLFKIVFEKMDQVNTPPHLPNKRKIGLKKNEET